MKIGIVSLFNMKNVNYGNRLQAIALNSYLQEKFPDACIESICLNDWGKKKITNYFSWIKLELYRFFKKTRNVDEKNELSKRLKAFNTFSRKNIQIIDSEKSISEIVDREKFDYVIVGSDIVWGQEAGYVNKELFLDLHSKSIKKIAYAASFGTDKIPSQNVNYVVSTLKNFQFLSIRESSMVDTLKKLGVTKATYVADPTLLITNKGWTSFEKKPEEKIPDRFIFCYLLGDGKEVRQQIERLAINGDIAVVTIPIADGIHGTDDKEFKANKLMNVSPEEWIWLIHHAEYVVTNSFHGTVFSTIFKKKFVVAKRKYIVDINERMRDFLGNTGQGEKIMELRDLDRLEDLSDDYSAINPKVWSIIDNSEKFIDDALLE